MFVGSIENQTIFTGTPTNHHERNLLTDAGFVHVTGLRYWHPDGVSHEDHFIGKNLRSEELGKYDHNNSMNVIVTIGGEVWIKAGACPDDRSDVILAMAPNGCGAFVPLSNGEQVSHHDLLMRISDPNYNIFVPAKN